MTHSFLASWSLCSLAVSIVEKSIRRKSFFVDNDTLSLSSICFGAYRFPLGSASHSWQDRGRGACFLAYFLACVPTAWVS